MGFIYFLEVKKKFLFDSHELAVVGIRIKVVMMLKHTRISKCIL